MNKKMCPTVGFGAPQTFGAHVFEVRISHDKSQVGIFEYFGLSSDRADDQCDHLIDLPYNTWRGIREPARVEFNNRLKSKKLPIGKWIFGITKLDRLLGKELCVLAWAVQQASNSEIPRICANWALLRPEERWWLYGMASPEGNSDGDRQNGWQRALYVALGGDGREILNKKGTTKHKPLKKNGHPQFSFLET